MHQSMLCAEIRQLYLFIFPGSMETQKHKLGEVGNERIVIYTNVLQEKYICQKLLKLHDF